MTRVSGILFKFHWFAGSLDIQIIFAMSCSSLESCEIPLVSASFSKSQVLLRITTDEYAFNATLSTSYGPRGDLESVNFVFGGHGFPFEELE